LVLAGRKNFVAGEILTAADVNSFLMDQSVMVFDNSAARTSAIPSPSEGMVTYLKDTNSLDKFDGTNFVPVDTAGLIAVKSVLKTDTFSASVTAGNNVAVSGTNALSITHEVQDPANKLIISAFFGASASSGGAVACGLALHDGAGLIAVGDAAGSRTQVTAGGYSVGALTDLGVASHAVTFVHTPGAGSKTYTVRAVNVDGSTRTLFVNRPESATDAASRPRAVSGLVIQEVAV
jgi:hypothetical protein